MTAVPHPGAQVRDQQVSRSQVRVKAVREPARPGLQPSARPMGENRPARAVLLGGEGWANGVAPGRITEGAVGWEEEGGMTFRFEAGRSEVTRRTCPRDPSGRPLSNSASRLPVTLVLTLT